MDSLSEFFNHFAIKRRPDGFLMDYSLLNVVCRAIVVDSAMHGKEGVAGKGAFEKSSGNVKTWE
jgi:hypothetical protein